MTTPVAGTAVAAHTFDSPDAESLVDPRLRGLVERYARLAGVTLRDLEPQLIELSFPSREAQYFRGRPVVRVAFSLAALERHPEAEMAVVGSAFLRELLDAVRTRGSRRNCGLVPPGFAADGGSAPLAVPARGATADDPSVVVAVHSLGRLVARVALTAAATVTEHIVESGVFDLVAGAPLPPDIVALCGSVERGEITPAPEAAASGFGEGRPGSMDSLVRLMLGALEGKLAAEIDRHRLDAERALAAELARIDRYYQNLLEEAAEDTGRVPADQRRAIEAEHKRRRSEEERRSDVRATVHPLQLIEFRLLVQRAEWILTTPAGRRGTFVASRALSGSGTWQLACPSCGALPTELLVCRHDHVACAACGKDCTVCGEAFCPQHGLAECHVDREPACDVHAHTCPACRRRHCTGHEARCSEGDHAACTACLGACGVCGRVVCTTHAFQSSVSSPRGARRLCRDCVVYCEGGTNEPVGRDEAVRCASCDKSVCEAHQAVCAVDKQVHCSKHLRRSDGSRRLLCEEHRDQCADEPHVIFASDEVGHCATCSRKTCDTHGGICVVDQQRHCRTHLARLYDTRDGIACEQHRTVCHVDDRTYSLTGTEPCPVCERLACAEHRRRCPWCGRTICHSDLDTSIKRCSTCKGLAPFVDPPDLLITAAIEANGGEPPTAKAWRSARDATHTVVELDLGWTRRLVFSVRHGDNVPQHVMRRSILGGRKQR